MRTLLIIPCYNEARSVGTLLREIHALDERMDTVVIDDGSRDDTARVAAALSPVVRLPVNLGIGGAVQTGLKYARAHGYEVCVQVDGDGQHPPHQVPVLLQSYRSWPANLVVGSRFLGPGAFRSTRLRRMGIRFIAAALRLFYGQSVTDPTSGFRLYDRRAIELFSGEYPLDYPEPISTALALKRGLTVREVPVEMRGRAHGASSIQGLRTLQYVLRVVGYLILIRFSRGEG